MTRKISREVRFQWNFFMLIVHLSVSSYASEEGIILLLLLLLLFQ